MQMTRWRSLLRRPFSFLRRFLRRVDVAVLPLAVVTLAALLALTFAAKVGEDVFAHESGGFDDAVRAWVLAHRTPAGFTLFLWITRLGGTAPVSLAAAGVGAWLWRRRSRPAAAAVLAAATGAVALFNAVKYLSGRPRPDGASLLHISTSAFPSGHATAVAAILPSASYILWREGLVSGHAAGAVSMVLVLLVGVSRIYLDVHWTTDVLGGWGAGMFVAAVAAGGYEWQRRRGGRDLSDTLSRSDTC